MGTITTAATGRQVSSTVIIVHESGADHIDKAIREGWDMSFLNRDATVQVNFEGGFFNVSSHNGTFEDIYRKCRSEFVENQKQYI